MPADITSPDLAYGPIAPLLIVFAAALIGVLSRIVYGVYGVADLWPLAASQSTNTCRLTRDGSASRRAPQSGLRPQA